MVRADVAGRFLAANVLLAGLQREYPAAFAVAVGRFADESAGDLAEVFLLAAAGEDTEVGSAEAERHTETLPLGHGDVRTVVAGPLQKADTNRIEAGDEHGPDLPRGFPNGLHLLQVAEEVGALSDHANRVVVDGGLHIVRVQETIRRREFLHAAIQVRHIGMKRLAVLGVNALGDEHFAGAAGDAEGHEHGLGDGRAAFVERGVCHFEARELGHHRLKFEDGLQRALARFGLIRRVRCVELAATRDGIHDARNEVIVGTAAEEADGIASSPILGREGVHVPRQFHLRQRRRDVERPLQAKLGRDRREEVVDGCDADLGEHRSAVFGRVEQVGHR